MNLVDRLNSSRNGKSSRKKEPSDINMSSVLSVGIVLVVGMCFAFILGILVGRGYRPENVVPPLAQVMPTTEPAHVDKPVGEPPRVLKPEELQFMEPKADKAGEVVAESTAKGSAEPKKIGPATLKSRDLPDARPAKAPVEPKAPFTKAAKRFRATYQIASFPAKNQAETMVKRLAAKGLTATVHEGKSKNRTMYRVHISLRGSEAEIRDGLRKTGEKGSILLDKKPL